MDNITVGAVGLGLIGASFAKGYKTRCPCAKVYGANRTRSVLEKAIFEGSIDAELDAGTLKECDIVIISIYEEAAIEYVRDNKDNFKKGAVVVDACGVKRRICKECFEIARQNDFVFVGGHPMAGTQFSGYDNSRADMFEGAPMILIADDTEHASEDLRRAATLLEPLGFDHFRYTDPDTHDKMIAYTSQTAHVLASAYVASAPTEDLEGFCGGAFRDMTRVAFLNAGMWTELFDDNREYLSESLGEVISNLIEFKDALDAKDNDKIYKMLEESSAKKERI